MRVRIETQDLRKGISFFQLFRKAMPGLLKNGLERVSKHALERSRFNAPILTGNLRGSLQISKPFKVGTDQMAVDFGSTLPYALRWHEEPFELGPISALQPGTPEGGVGNKYIERVINIHKLMYSRWMHDDVEVFLSEKAKK